MYMVCSQQSSGELLWSLPQFFLWRLMQSPTRATAVFGDEFDAGCQREHPCNTGPMLSSRRCGAKTRSGKLCKSPAVSGKRRCRMHGGAPGSGAPRGNKNALKHGRYTREAIEERQQLQGLLRQSRMLIQKIE